MRKITKKIVSLLLCSLIMLGSIAVGGEGFTGFIDAFTVKASAATYIGKTPEEAAEWASTNVWNCTWNFDGSVLASYYGEPQCVDWFRMYTTDFLGIDVGSIGGDGYAQDIKYMKSVIDNFDIIDSGAPRKGDIFVDYGLPGHVGVVIDVYSDNSFQAAHVNGSDESGNWHKNQPLISKRDSYGYLVRPNFKQKHKINADLCTASAAEAYEGARIYVKPATKTGWSFTGFEGASFQIVDGLYSFVMPNNDVTVRAVYKKDSQDITRKLEGKTVTIKAFDNGCFLHGGTSDNSKVETFLGAEPVASKYKVLVHSDGWASFLNTSSGKFLTVQGNNGSEYLGCYANDCQSYECFKIYKYGDDFYLLSQRTGRLMQLNERSLIPNYIIPTDQYYDVNHPDGADWERFRIFENRNELYSTWNYSGFESNAIVDSVKKILKVLHIQDKYKIPETVPVREGYSFVGWSASANSNTAEYQPGDVVENSDGLVLYEVWNKINTDMSLSAYTCEFDITKKTSETIHVHADGDFPSKASSVFVSSDNNSVVVASTSKSIIKQELWHETMDSDITITAKNPGKAKITVSIGNPAYPESVSSTIDVDVSATYTITFNVDGEIRTQTKKYNEDITLLDFIPEKENHFFLGWSTAFGATKPIYGPGDVYRTNGNITFYPVWSKKEYVKIKSFSNGVLTLEGNGIMASYPTGKTPWKDYASSCTKIVIESGVNTIGANAFSDFVKLNTVVLPNDLTGIGSKAFYNCSNLVNINAPSSLKHIGSSAFEGCSKLKKPPIPAGAGSSGVSIGAYAFKSCLALTALVIPDPVIAIGIGIFEGCIGLRSVEMPSSIQEIPETAFFGCKSLENIELPDSLGIIDNGAFSGCSSIAEIEIPDSVAEIGEQAFSGCVALSEVQIPENVECVGVSAFSNCSMLESVDIPEDIQYLGVGAFSGCSVLDNVILPDSIKVIPDGLFTNCSSLSNIEYSDDIAAIGNSAFLGCSSLAAVYWPNTLTEINDYAFYNCTSLGYVSLNDGLKEIGNCAFANCEAVSCVDIPASVDSIGDLAFMNCTSLSALNMQETDISIGDYAFSGCTALSDVTLPDGAVVGEDIFSDCSSALKVNCYSTSAALKPINDSGITTNTIYRVESVNLNKTQAAVDGGKTLQLSASILPQNATNKKLYWISSDESIATVDENGLVTGVSSGEVTVKAVADDGLINGECKVNVRVPVTGLTISNDSIESFVGNDFILSCNLSPKSPTNTAVTWSSSNPDIVSVDNDGVIKLIGEGTASITVKSSDGGFSDTCLVTSKKYVPISGLTLDKTSQQLHVGDAFDLGVTVNPSNSTDSFYDWSLEPEGNENIISIDENNKVTALSSGTVTVYAVSGNIKSNGCVIAINDSNTLSFNANGGSGAPTDQTGNGTITLSDTIPTRTGYTFLGWATSSAAASAEYQPKASFNLTSDTILYAIWQKELDDPSREYTVTWSADGNTTTAKYKEGSNIVKPADPVKTGYTFKGWTPSVPAAMPANDLKFTAVFEENSSNLVSASNIIVASARTIDYRSIVTVKASATDIPEDYILAIYLGDQKVAEGDNESVSYTYGELKSTLNYTVKVIDADGNVQKDSNGNDISKDGGKITCNAGFFKRLIAFIRGLYKMLPKVEVKP